MSKTNVVPTTSFCEVDTIILCDGIRRTITQDGDIDLHMSPITNGPVDVASAGSFIPKEFSLRSRLGRGEFGEVFLSVSESGKQVVMKRIPKKSHNFKWEYIRREHKAGVILDNHDTIVPCITVFETSNNVYLVFPYFESKDLISWLEDRNFWPLEDKHARKIFLQIATAVSICHRNGIGHRDIKLDNVLVNKAGKIKLIDFGLCTIEDDSKQVHTDRVGSADYVAPEVLMNRPYNSFKADIFSMGVVLYCLLFGKFPFNPEERLEDIRKGIITSFSLDDKEKLFTSLSKEAKELLSMMLEPEPEKRISMEGILTHKWLNQK